MATKLGYTEAMHLEDVCEAHWISTQNVDYTIEDYKQMIQTGYCPKEDVPYLLETIDEMECDMQRGEVM